MNRLRTPLALGLLVTGLTSCESPTLFRNNTITLSPLSSPASGATARTSPKGYGSNRAHSSRLSARPLRANRSGTVTVQTRQQPKLMVFDVRDLLMANPNFVAPEMDVFGSGGQPEYPEPLEAQAFIDEDTLLDSLRAAIPSHLLDEDSTMKIVGGRLFITSPEE